MAIRLTGPQRERLRQGLLSAFPGQNVLEEMLLFQLNKALDAIVSPGSLSRQMAELIRAAEAEGWTRELIVGAIASNPDNPMLNAAAGELGVVIETPREQ